MKTDFNQTSRQIYNSRQINNLIRDHQVNGLALNQVLSQVSDQIWSRIGGWVWDD